MPGWHPKSRPRNEGLIHLPDCTRFSPAPKRAEKSRRTRPRQPRRRPRRNGFYSSFETRPWVDAYRDARPRRCARGRLPRLTGGRRPGHGDPARRTRRVASPPWLAHPRIRAPRDAPPRRARRPRNRASPSALLLRRRPRPRARRTKPAGPARMHTRASPRVGPRSRCGASRRRARARAWRPPSSDAGPWNEPRALRAFSVHPANASALLRLPSSPTRCRLPRRRTRW